MTDVNIPLLRKAVEWAEVEAAKPPEVREWNQGAFILPAPSDLPSFTASDWSSDAKAWAAYAWRSSQKSPECGTCFCIAGYIAYQTTGNLDYSKAEEIALEALGLKDDIVGDYEGALFSANNSIKDVRRIAEEIAGERL